MTHLRWAGSPTLCKVLNPKGDGEDNLNKSDRSFQKQNSSSLSRLGLGKNRLQINFFKTRSRCFDRIKVIEITNQQLTRNPTHKMTWDELKYFIELKVKFEVCPPYFRLVLITKN